ncbi:MAG TPA: NlpC/P60 family protein [Candidatus Saccharimonadales bacterium]|nr:NlpC/P60 family protein [Candidatus Saccharimonadales bacterium]
MTKPPKDTGSGGAGVVVCLVVLGIAIGQSHEWWGVSDWVSSVSPNEWHFAASETEVSADGSAILAAAQKYDGERYVWGGGHPPASFKPGSGLDCSGLVDRAVFEATQVNENNTAASFRNSKHWTQIPFTEAKAGDIMYRLKKRKNDVDHVVIVVSNGGDGKLTIFEAATSKGPVKLQVRQRDNVNYGEFDAALRFTK